MKIGDRVTVVLPHIKFSATIVGEGRKGEWWHVLRDGNKATRAINKRFCKPEEVKVEQ